MKSWSAITFKTGSHWAALRTIGPSGLWSVEAAKRAAKRRGLVLAGLTHYYDCPWGSHTRIDITN